jgi:membrane-bound lytic murein transglycosylase C
MKKIFLIIPFFLFFAADVSSVSFEEFKIKSKSGFKSYSDAVENDFEQYQKELKEAFKEYRKKISEVWGDKNSVISDKKQYVSYFNDLTERNIIDFENGLVKVQIIVQEKDLKNLGEIKSRLEKSVERAVVQKPDYRSITQIAKNPETHESKELNSVLKNQVKDKDGNTITPENSALFAAETVKSKKFESVKIKDDNNNEKVVVSIDFPLAEDHIKKRALEYVDIVIPESKKRNINHELIFAVMETESSFNPLAKSPIPAFGLMQLVPTTAGRDSYRLVYKKDMAPTDKFLYEPKNNIELGCAYLYILFNRYLDEIENPKSRLWCVIAGYNTGIGNVFETFSGKYSKSKYATRQLWKLSAFEKINSMEPENVYEYLFKNLPYKETRNYIKKVRLRMAKYKTGK